MSVLSYGELDGLIIRTLNKTTANRGFYTTDKVADAVQESLTYIASLCFIAGQGWQSKMDHVTTVANQETVDIKPHWAMIKKLFYLVGSEYMALKYDDNPEASEYAGASGMTQWPCTYRIVENQIYFNPPLAEGGTNYLRVEYMAYPKIPQNEIDTLDFHVNDTWKEFIKYHSAKVCHANFEKGSWGMSALYEQWHSTLKMMLDKRNLQTTDVRDAYP